MLFFINQYFYNYMITRHVLKEVWYKKTPTYLIGKDTSIQQLIISFRDGQGGRGGGSSSGFHPEWGGSKALVHQIQKTFHFFVGAFANVCSVLHGHHVWCHAKHRLVHELPSKLLLCFTCNHGFLIHDYNIVREDHVRVWLVQSNLFPLAIWVSCLNTSSLM